MDCNHNCFNCLYIDCIIDDYVSREDKARQNIFDRDILPYTTNYRYKMAWSDKYEKPELLKARQNKYDSTEKGIYTHFVLFSYLATGTGIEINICFRYWDIARMIPEKV